MENIKKVQNRYIFFINIEEQARKIYEKSYKNEGYKKIEKDYIPENIMIMKKEYEIKISDEILEFILNLTLKYNIKKVMIIDLSDEIDNILNEIKEDWKKYMEINHNSILKLKRKIEQSIVNKKIIM